MDTFIFESGIISGDVNRCIYLVFEIYNSTAYNNWGLLYNKKCILEEFIERKELKYDVEPSDKIGLVGRGKS